jgi:thymidylate synthase
MSQHGKYYTLNKHDIQYHEMLEFITEYGNKKTDRTGTGVKSIFDYTMRFDLRDGSIPLLTTKKMFTKGIIHELLWFLSGDTNITYLKQNGVSIWDEWADEKGDLGPVYGAQWRKWTGFHPSTDTDIEYMVIVDQIQELIWGLKKDPDSRRHVVSAWNVAEIDNMKLPPCHMVFQCYVANGELSLKLTQRSCDSFLGVPFNIAQYSILVHMLAQVCNLKPGDFIWSGNDVHIYDNHVEPVSLQLSRISAAEPPKLILNKEITDIFEFTFNDFSVINYESHPAIKAVIAI